MDRTQRFPRPAVESGKRPADVQPVAPRAMVWMSPSVRMLQSGSRRPFARRCTTSVFPTSTPPTAEMPPRRNQPPRPSPTASATLPLTTARMAPTAPALSTSAHDPVERPINRKSPPTEGRAAGGRDREHIAVGDPGMRGPDDGCDPGARPAADEHHAGGEPGRGTPDADSHTTSRPCLVFSDRVVHPLSVRRASNDSLTRLARRQLM